MGFSVKALKKQQQQKSSNIMKPIQIVALVNLAMLASASTIQTKDGVPVDSGAEPSEKTEAFGLAVRNGKKIDSGAKTHLEESRPRPGTYIAEIGNRYCPIPDGRNAFQNSCHRFVICSNGQLSQFGQCPTGQVFEPAIANCIDIGRSVQGLLEQPAGRKNCRHPEVLQGGTGQA